MLVPFYGCSYGFLEAIPSYCQCCVCGGYVLGEEVRGGFYADGFAWSGEGWGTSWGMGAFCVPAVGGWVLVFSIAVIAPHEHSTHEHPTKWSTHNPLKPKTTRGGTIMCHPQPSTQTGEKILARRNTAASKKAAEYAEKFAQREEKLQSLAAEFFQLEADSEYGRLQKRLADYRQKLYELQAQSDEAEAELREQQAPVIVAMRDAGESSANIAVRLGVPHVMVTRALRAEKEKQASITEDAPAGAEDHQDSVEISIYSNDEEKNYHESAGE